MILLDLNTNQPNPVLFKGERPTELKPETYYAYLDSVEQIDHEFHIQFDCVVKNVVDDIQISTESLVELPSIIIKTKGAVDRIRDLFDNRNLYQQESKWMIIKTQFNKSESYITQSLYFNFQEVRVESSLIYNLESIRLFSDLNSVERSKIRELEKATTLEKSNEKEVISFLQSVDDRLQNQFSHVNVYKVGQGNCIGLVNSANRPLLYYDVGGGFNANADTYPPNFKLCNTNNPPVILSHWDQDHYQTAVLDQEEKIFNSKWLAPIQKIGPTARHIAFALERRQNLICWNESLPQRLDFTNFTIVKCTGNSKNKNSSGLALFVNQQDNNHILLPGDAKFEKIPDCSIEQFTGLVASHHGAYGEIKGLPVANFPGMLVYSYGLHPDGSINSHKHPHEPAKTAYMNKGWCDVRETIKGSIAMSTNLLDLQPECGGRGCTLIVEQQY